MNTINDNELINNFSSVLVIKNPVDESEYLSLYNKDFWDTGVAGAEWIIECDLHGTKKSIFSATDANKALGDMDWCEECKNLTKENALL